MHATGSVSTPVSSLNVSAGPKLGYAWIDTDKTLRSISGVPGSAHFTDSVTSPGTYQFGAADPSGKFSLLLGQGRTIYRMALPDGLPVLLSSESTDGASIRFSPEGTSAMVFVPGRSEGILLTGLLGTPQLRSLTFTLPILDAAVSGSGGVAVAMQASGNVSVQVLPASGTIVALPSVQGFGGMAFVAGTDDLVLADSVANTLSRISHASTSPSPALLSTSGFLKQPVSVATSRSARWVIVANDADATVLRIDLSGRVPVQRTVCTCKPSVITQLTTDGAFRLTAANSGPMWITDAANPAFPTLFVPALFPVASK